MKAPRPKSMTVCSILNFVFGGLGLLLAFMGLIMLPNAPFTDGREQTVGGFFTDTFFNIFVGVLAIVSGIGLSKVAVWGRGCAIAYGIVAILGGILLAAVMVILAAGQAAGQPLLLCVFLGMFRCIYPVVLLSYLNSSKWKEVFAERRNETV